ncbi:MAG: hypothetical protein ACI4TU_00460 [Candidatus Cryptobacteroides sp.]
MKIRYLFFVLTSLIALSSCKSQFEMMLNSNDVEAKYEAAFKYFNDRKYN